MSYIKTIRLDSYALQAADIVRLDPVVYLQPKSVLTGTISDSNGNPESGAVVEITEVWQNNRTTLGYTMTDQNGYYFIAIPINPQAVYEIVAYST